MGLEPILLYQEAELKSAVSTYFTKSVYHVFDIHLTAIRVVIAYSYSFLLLSKNIYAR